ncbi:MAG: LytTR family DNA-binding domain-containing protein [Bacteroidota bacterium]
MNTGKISTNWSKLNTRRNKTLLWILLLFLASWNYYREFFLPIYAILLAMLISGETFGMFAVGYFQLSKSPKFPKYAFWSWTVGFTVLRWLVVYFFLQHHLPEWTVFHYPERSVFYLFFTSAAFIFIGYSYSIYEWGLAAKTEYVSKINKIGKDYQHPVQIRSEGKTVHLLPQEIIYLEAKGEYVNYVTRNSNHMCFQRLKTAEKELKEYGLLRAHRSYIVNPLNIKAFSSSEIVMNNADVVPVSNSYKTDLMEKLKADSKSQIG